MSYTILEDLLDRLLFAALIFAVFLLLGVAASWRSGLAAAVVALIVRAPVAAGRWW
ncbi:MAG: hypothetical protein ACLFWG_10150 [Longimicrobiales bacterium]